MRRQYLRLFFTMGTSQKFPHTMRIPYYLFCQATKADDYRAILFQLSQIHQRKQSDHKQVSRLIQQLKPYLPQFENKEIRELVSITLTQSISDENYAQKVFDRTTQLYLEQQATLTETLDILSLLVPGTYSKQFYQQLFNFVAAVSQAPELTPTQIGLSMFIYGQVSQYTKCNNKEVENSLILNFKQYIDHFKSIDLKNFAFGLLLARIKRKDIYEILEKQSLVTEMQFEDLIRVGTGIALFGNGSPEFWKLLEEQAINNIPTTNPQNITTLFMLYKQLGHGTAEIFKLLESIFIQRYDQFNNLQKLQMFSSFAKIRYPSSAIFKLFFKDIVGIIQSVNITAVQMLIFDCQKIFPQFPKQVQQYFINFILKHYQKFNPTIKSKLYDSFQEQKLLTEELEVALLKKK
ncbi:unnamed protein product [Paramecium sonneborni]|uniref:Uncharacterized protein n=1 Tax=Paramecium sonneborni TaxID=65129 RepID=A0A8S1ND58_9CILI|nr:unnamed protein product [Paramecium sonneborni]